MRVVGVRVLVVLSVMAGVLIARDAAAQNCSVDVAPVSFGAYDVFAPAALDSTGSVTVQCLLALVVQVRLGPGAHGTFATRALQGPSGDLLGYNLFTTAGRDTVWGDGTGTTAFVTVILSVLNLTQTRTVYGRIGAGQNVSVGVYADTVAVTIVF